MLVSKTNQLVEEVNELKDSYIGMINSDVIEFMDEKTFTIVKNSFKLLNTLMEVMQEQAEIIESNNKKLDKLLRIAES